MQLHKVLSVCVCKNSFRTKHQLLLVIKGRPKSQISEPETAPLALIISAWADLIKVSITFKDCLVYCKIKYQDDDTMQN